MSGDQMALLRGTLDVLVLKALEEESRHGYDVARWVRRTTDGALEVEDGALYTSLHRMQKRGWVEAEWGLSENNRRAKYYQLTADGRDRLREAAGEWTRYVAAVTKVLESGGAS
jgi:transcriptional regulator